MVSECIYCGNMGCPECGGSGESGQVNKQTLFGLTVLVVILLIVAVFVFVMPTISTGGFIFPFFSVLPVTFDLPPEGTQTTIVFERPDCQYVTSRVLSGQTEEWDVLNFDIASKRGTLKVDFMQDIILPNTPLEVSFGLPRAVTEGYNRNPTISSSGGTIIALNPNARCFEETIPSTKTFISNVQGGGQRRPNMSYSCGAFIDGVLNVDNGENISRFFSERIGENISQLNKEEFTSINFSIENIGGGSHLFELKCKYILSNDDFVIRPVTENQIRYASFMTFPTIPHESDWQSLFSANFWKEDDLCGKINDGFLIYTENRSGSTAGKNILSKANTDFPMEAVCPLNFPMIKLLADGSIVKSTSELVTIEKGEEFEIPEGEIWRFSYLISTNTKLQIDCEALGGILTDTGICDVTGFVDACTGEINDFGQCITTVDDPCPDGFLVSGQCFETPTFNKQCGWLGQYDVDADLCIRPADEIGDCRGIEEWDFERKRCFYAPLRICPSFGSQYNFIERQCEFNPNGFGEFISRTAGLDIVGAGIILNYDFATGEWFENSVFKEKLDRGEVEACPTNWTFSEESDLQICSKTPTSREMCIEEDRTFNFETGECQGDPLTTRCDFENGFSLQSIDGELVCVKATAPIELPIDSPFFPTVPPVEEPTDGLLLIGGVIVLLIITLFVGTKL